MKEINYKPLHEFYPAKVIKDIDVNCQFGCEYTETVVHFLWHCPAVKTLWSHICNFVTEKTDNSFVLLSKNVLFGFTDQETLKQNLQAYHMINLL